MHVAVRVRESRRARTLRLSVGPRRPLELVVPRHVRDAEVDRFLALKRDWIARKLALMREIAERPPRLGLERAGVVWAGGRPLPLASLDGRVTDTAALDRWYRREARRRITEVAGREAARLGLEYAAIAIRDQRTRWGSCSRRGTLSFSWRLLLAPAEGLEYVVVHELCHLREPNHSKAFWRVLDAARPGWRAQAGWLHEHGQELQDYRPAAAMSRQPALDGCASYTFS